MGRCEDVRKGRVLPAEPKGVTFPPIPAGYDEYQGYKCVRSQEKLTRPTKKSTKVKGVKKTIKKKATSKKTGQTKGTRVMPARFIISKN